MTFRKANAPNAVVGRIPLEEKHLRHILDQKQQLGCNSLRRNVLAPRTNSARRKHQVEKVRGGHCAPNRSGCAASKTICRSQSSFEMRQDARALEHVLHLLRRARSRVCRSRFFALRVDARGS